MRAALVVGATGLVGNKLIDELIADNTYHKVIVFSRRKLQVSHPKVEVLLIDFDRLEEVSIPEKIDVCFCTLGTTQKKSGKNGLYKVDYMYVLLLARFCFQYKIPRYLIVSSQGANVKSPFFYLQTKGQMEEAVKNIGIETVYIVRPSLITGKREEIRVSEQIGYYLYKILTPIMTGKLRKFRPVSGTQIAKSLIDLAQNSERGNYIIESDFIQKF